MNPLMKALLKGIAGIRGEPNLNDLLDRSDAVLAEAASDPLAPARNSKRRHSFATGSPMEELRARQIPRMLPTSLQCLIEVQNACGRAGVIDSPATSAG